MIPTFIHFNFCMFTECLRSENWNLPCALEQARRRVDWRRVGLGAASRRSGAFGLEGDWHFAATRRCFSSSQRQPMGAHELTRAGRSCFVLRKALHDVFLPHQT